MSTISTVAVAPEGLGAPIGNVDDAIAETARLDAILEVAGDRRKALKAWVGTQLGRAGTKIESEGLGTALLTDPKARPVIVDDEAFRAWALREHPDATQTVQRVDPRAIERALAGEEGEEIAARLTELLDSIPGAVTTDVTVSDKLAGQVAKPGEARELEDGRLVVKATGEVIPGLRLELASDPAPQVKADKELVARLVEEITGRLTPLPALEEGPDTEEPSR